MLRRLLVAAACIIALHGVTRGQDADTLARDPVAFLDNAQKTLKWNEPADPVKIIGPLWFVGTKGLGAFLITTSDGLILLNTGMPGSGPMIADSIRKAGFKPEDVKMLLAGHAHVDHVGGHAYIQKLSHARVAMIAEEVDLLESGGKLDFQYGIFKEFAFDPVKVDEVFHDGEMIKLGNVFLIAQLTPGHTKGSTTFIMNVVDNGKTYNVVFPSGAAINPGYRLVKNPSYSGIADDYRRTFHELELLRPDIWLDAHTDAFDFEAKRARATSAGVSAWVDRAGYQRYLAERRAKFDEAMAKEGG